MNDTQLLELLATTDAYADDAALPEAVWTRDAALAEIERRMDMTDTKTREPVTPSPQRPQRRTWLAAAAAFVIVVVAGIAIALASRSPEAPPVQPPTTTTEATTTTGATTTTVAEASGPIPLTTNFGSVEVGTYVLDKFDPPITFTVDPSFFFVQQNTTSRLALSAPNSRDPGDRDMVLLRLENLSDPTNPTDFVQDQNLWPANDFAGWLDNVVDGIVVTDRVEATIGGLPAVGAELQLGDIECGPDARFCALLGSRSSTRTVLEPGSIYRVWVIDDGTEEPLAVVLAILNERDRSWFDAFENLLMTFEFGE